jgi:hypothetical protein
MPVRTVKIVLDDDTFHLLKRSIPQDSHARKILDAAEYVKFFEVILSCSEGEARYLLLYFENCPKAVAAIQQALRAADLSEKSSIG